MHPVPLFLGLILKKVTFTFSLPHSVTFQDCRWEEEQNMMTGYEWVFCWLSISLFRAAHIAVKNIPYFFLFYQKIWWHNLSEPCVLIKWMSSSFTMWSWRKISLCPVYQECGDRECSISLCTVNVTAFLVLNGYPNLPFFNIFQHFLLLFFCFLFLETTVTMVLGFSFPGLFISTSTSDLL